MVNSLTNVVDRMGNDTNVSATIETGNLKTSRLDDSSGDYTNLRATEKTDVLPNIRDKEWNNYSDVSISQTTDVYILREWNRHGICILHCSHLVQNYEWRLWHVIYYLEKTESQSNHEEKLTSSIDEYTTDDWRKNNSNNITHFT